MISNTMDPMNIALNGHHNYTIINSNGPFNPHYITRGVLQSTLTMCWYSTLMKKIKMLPMTVVDCVLKYSKLNCGKIPSSSGVGLSSNTLHASEFDG
jgi:hypothetical protein